MGIAYLDRALKMNDRIKGYTVYGTLAEYQLTDLDGYENITEKVAGKGFFTLFHTKVFEYKSDSEPNILKKYDPENEDDLFVTEGSVLVYIDDVNMLGKDVSMSVVGKTSYQEIRSRKSKNPAILSWERHAGTENKWEIVPTKCKLIKQEGSSRYNPYFIKRAGNDKYNTLSQYIFTRCSELDNVNTPTWTGNIKIVSSKPQRLKPKKAKTSLRLWEDLSNTFKPTGIDNHAYLRIQHLQKQALKKQGMFLQEKIRFCTEHQEEGQKWCNQIIDSYLDQCLNTWDENGKNELRELFDEIEDLTEKENKKEAVRRLRMFMQKYMPVLVEEVKEEITRSLTTFLPNKEVFAILIVAHLAKVSLNKVYQCIKRIRQAKRGLTTLDCLILLCTDPYFLILLGGSLKYNDCLQIESTLSTGEEPDTKGIVYALKCYREYTKDSKYRDMLISESEWVWKNKLSEQKNQDRRNTQGLLYFKKVNNLTAHITPEKPRILLKKKDITDYNPITVAQIPHRSYFDDPFCLLISQCVNKGMVWIYDGYYIPTYESFMELAIIGKIKNINCDLLGYSSYESYIDILDKITVDQNTSVFISDSNVTLNNNNIVYRYKEAYKEPTFFVESEKKKDTENNPIQYIIGELENYTVWELYTLLQKIKKEDKVIFLADPFRRPPNKGVAVLPIIKCLKGIKMQNVSEEEYYHNTKEYNRHLLRMPLTDELFMLKSGDAFKIRRITEQLDGVLEDLIGQKDTKIITTSKDLAKKSVQFYDLKLKKQNADEFFKINEDIYYYNEVLQYDGKSEPERPLYTLKKREEDGRIVFEKVSQCGLYKKQKLILQGIFQTKNIVQEKNKYFTKYNYTIVASTYNKELKTNVLVLFDVKMNPKTKQVKGVNFEYLKKCIAEDINHMSSDYAKRVYLLVDDQAKCCREDIYTAISLAQEEVIICGDVGIQKSALTRAIQTEYPKQVRTLLELRRSSSDEKRKEDQAQASKESVE